MRLNKEFWEGEGKQEKKQDKKNKKDHQKEGGGGGRGEEEGGRSSIEGMDSYSKFAADLKARSMGRGVKGEGEGEEEGEGVRYSLEGGQEPYILDRVREWENRGDFPELKLKFVVCFFWGEF